MKNTLRQRLFIIIFESDTKAGRAFDLTHDILHPALSRSGDVGQHSGHPFHMAIYLDNFVQLSSNDQPYYATGTFMKRIRPTTKFSALLLLVLTLNTLAYSLILPRLELASLQAQAVCTASLTDTDSEEQERLGDCKPPKHSFIDYTSFFSPKSFLPAYNPEISSLLAYEPFHALPSVYLEIIVPPDSLA